MIPEPIQTRILEELASIEEREQVTIVYACESGSRAWGFESQDSDYDVRFLYVRKTDGYLSITNRRDVIEKPIDDELDISGWDLPKALNLLKKSNPPLLEWLQSPVVYQQKSSCVDRIRNIMTEYYSPISCMYHYLHMAENNYRKYLKTDQVRTKKYFYVLRPVLACIWIERGLGIVPIEFDKLVEQTVQDQALLKEIEILLANKRAGTEMGEGPRNPALSDFLDQQLARIRAENQRPAITKDLNTLNQLFLDVLLEVNGPEFM